MFEAESAYKDIYMVKRCCVHLTPSDPAVIESVLLGRFIKTNIPHKYQSAYSLQFLKSHLKN